MNCPLRPDDGDGREGWNQNPGLLAGTTRQDLNGIANSRVLRRIESHEPNLDVPDGNGNGNNGDDDNVSRTQRCRKNSAATMRLVRTLTSQSQPDQCHVTAGASESEEERNGSPGSSTYSSYIKKIRKILTTFGKFVGPGFMISVAYIDPGNYSTDVAAGASYRFQLLFIVLWANIAAIYLQSLCIKLGTVTGMDLAQMCRAHLPWWLNIFLYILAEVAIIATDISEVVGTAIAVNLLIPKIPLVAGCAISICDVLLILTFYRPNGSMKGLRAFEFFVVALVLGVVICFCIQLSLIQNTSVGEVLRGFLPSSAIIESEGLYQACGILGATVMPHSLYLGSGIVQPRLLDYDVKNGHVAPPPRESSGSSVSSSKKTIYQPSLSAINFCLTYSIVELAVSLFTFALFVNSSILIVAGSSLSSIPNASSASLFSIYDLLASSISPAAGTIFALALLLSGISAGIVCTIAGQMISEGALNWTIAPWLRRLITRSISIIPSIIVAGAVGRDGLSAALNASQVALSIVLPFVTAPLVYFTSRNKYMTVKPLQPGTRLGLRSNDHGNHEGEEREHDSSDNGKGEGATRPLSILSDHETGNSDMEGTKMRNHWATTTIAIIIWVIIAAMNVANLVLLGLGK